MAIDCKKHDWVRTGEYDANETQWRCRYCTITHGDLGAALKYIVESERKR